jgi:hypothetical protein
MEIILIGIIIIFIVSYRTKKGESVYKFISQQAIGTYKKIEPYSFKVMRDKVKRLGLEYTPKQYLFQIILFAGLAGIISYLYFYNLIISIVYIVIAVSFIPYITYLRCKRQYSEYIFPPYFLY